MVILGMGLISNFTNPTTISIERKDSKLGYTKTNVVLVTAIVNSMKNDYSEEDFINTINLITKNYKK